MTASLKIHPCVDCRDLPIRPFDPADIDPTVEYRPTTPRPAPHGGPRSRRCDTHQRRHDRAARTRAADKRRENVYGLDPETRAELIDIQGGACPICARGLDRDSRGRPRKTATDHDHECCPAPPTCGNCTRGVVCGYCNRELLARLEQMPGGGSAAALRLYAYFTDPPMARVRRGRMETA